MDRARVWLAVSPIIVAGVLSGHALAYRLTGTPTGAIHGYLDHSPQVVLILALVAPLLGLRARSGAFALWPFPAAGVATFVIQEHVERLVHSGQVPLLLASPAFVVGVLLQVPVAVVVWALARRLLAVLAESLPARRRLLPRFVLDVALPAPFDVRAVAAAPLPGRGPPLLRAS